MRKRIHRRASFLPILVLVVSGLTAAATLSAHAQPDRTARWYYEPQYEPSERQADMLHMRLEVEFTPTEKLVRGRVTHTFRPLRPVIDSLFFHGPGIRIIKALYNGRPAPFVTNPGGVVVSLSPPARWDTQDSITFIYEAHPRRGLYFIGWNDTTDRSRKQIWSQGQGIDNRHWIPCWDEQNDKLITETIITFDSRYRVLSNGTKVMERRNADGTTTWHYRMSHPHSVYLVMLGIGEYAVETRTTRSGVPVHLWYYPDQADRVEPTYRWSTDAIDFMEAETGVPYPWESYSQIPVQDFLYGGMENTTATVFGDFYLVDRRAFLDKNYVYVNLHELTHQWFGDYVTGRVGRNAWLHESFATFYPKLFFRKTDGEDAYQWSRRREQDAALSASRLNRFPILHSQAGSDRVYSKGSAVIDMMRYAFGEEPVRRVITQYLRSHAYGLVETNDLYQTFQDVLGLSPAWFFNEWIYRGGEPEYEVSYRDVVLAEMNERQTVITVRQVHQRDELVGLFRMPVVFEVNYDDGSRDSCRVEIERETETVVVPNPRNKGISFVLIDPESWILKTLTFPRTFTELESQALRARGMIDRYDAVVALRQTPIATKRELLKRVYRRETFYAVRAEVAEQLANDLQSREVFPAIIHDPSTPVRLAFLNATERVQPDDRPMFETLLTDSSYDVVAASLKKLVDQFPEERSRYFALTSHDEGVGHQVRVLWHELRAGAGSTADRDSLTVLASPALEFRTRVNAFEALKRLNECDTSLVLSLCDAMTHTNGRLRGPATDVARYFLQQAAYRPLFSEVIEAKRWEEWQREILLPFMNGK